MRYSITFTDRPGAKARYRQALKMMGAENVTITEKEQEITEPKPRKDNTPTNDLSKSVASLYGRSHETEWTDLEIAAFRTAAKTKTLTLENMKLVTEFYAKERKKEKCYCRTSLLVFCRNWTSELDKAKAAKPVASKALEWIDSNKIVALPDPAEVERARLAAKESAAAFRAQQREAM